MVPDESIFQRITDARMKSGPKVAVDELVQYLRSQKKYRELFEALKMQSRLRLGLPAVAMEGAQALTIEEQDLLERDLLRACREVGLGLLEEGRIEEGWMYLRPVGDREGAAQALAKIPVDSENLDLMLQILVHEAVDVGRGTRLSLEHRGTCNTITMMESIVSMRGRHEQQQAVAELLRHVHTELLDGMKADLRRREGKEPAETSAEAMLLARPTWLKDGTYHMDTTHLSSTVRFARVLDDKELIAKALDLTHYGVLLHPQYQYPGDEPFGDLYAMSRALFQTLLGIHVDPNLKLFLQKAESLDIEEHGTVAIETYADLLARIGRPMEALHFLLRRMPEGMRPCGIAPSILELSAAARDFEPMLKHSSERGDIIGFTAALATRP